jgi:hypothetical protein
MMADSIVRVEGAEKLALLGKAIRLQGSDRTILKELTKNVKKLSLQVRTELKLSAASVLPKRGGLGGWVAKSRVNTSVRRGANTAGVTVTMGRNSKGARSDLRGMDAGLVRHPLFGNRHIWYPQRIADGFATKVFEGPAAEEFTNETLDAIDAAIAEVNRGF